jgi:ferritin-like metal-binding protein YciE
MTESKHRKTLDAPVTWCKGDCVARYRMRHTVEANPTLTKPSREPQQTTSRGGRFYQREPARTGTMIMEMAMANTKTFDDLSLQFLQDLYYAERQILKALPKMAKAATSETLKQALLHHREETEGQVERLQRVFESMGKRARGVTCEAINGLIEEGEEVIEDFPSGSVRDAGILACAQAVEHYEIARYGALVEWAKEAKHDEAVKLLQETLAEEKQADTKLNQLAISEINHAALAQAA